MAPTKLPNPLLTLEGDHHEGAIQREGWRQQITVNTLAPTKLPNPL